MMCTEDNICISGWEESFRGEKVGNSFTAPFITAFQFHKYLITETIKLYEILGPGGVQTAPLRFSISRGGWCSKWVKQKQICHMQAITCCAISVSSTILFSFLYTGSQVATSNYLNKMGW